MTQGQAMLCTYRTWLRMGRRHHFDACGWPVNDDSLHEGPSPRVAGPATAQRSVGPSLFVPHHDGNLSQ